MVFEKMQVQGKSNTVHEGAKRGYGRMSVIQICNDNNIGLQEALSRLKNAGIEATGENTLRELGQNYNKSPMDIVKIIERTGEK